MFSLKNRLHILFAAIFITACILIFFVFSCPKTKTFYHYGAFGTKDLLTNWASVQVFLLGENPYDSNQMLPFVQRWGYAKRTPPAAWFPPWAIVLLSLVYFLDFPIVVVIWFVINLAIVYLITLLIVSVYANREIKFIYLEIASIIFYPLWALLRWGHIGILLPLGLAGTIWAFKKGDDRLAGLFMVLLMMKAHVVYLILLYITLWIINQKRWTAMIWFAGGLSFLMFVAFIWNHSIFEWWFLSFYTKAGNYRAATLVGWMRGLLINIQGYPPKWPMILVPFCAIALLLYGFYVKRALRSIEEIIPVVACVSVLTAPYAWMHDFVIILVTQIALICRTCDVGSIQRVRAEVISAILVLNLITFILGKNVFHSSHEYFWFPAVLLLLWFRGNRLREKQLNQF